MKKRLVVSSAFILIASQSWADVAQLTDLDRQVIGFINEHGHYTDHPGYPDDHPYWDKLQWYRDLGDKVRPSLMYLLTDEYAGDLDKMADVIDCLEYAPGDHSDIVSYVRSNLPGMLRSEESYGKVSFIQSSIYVLGKHGAPEDMDLIQSFFDYHDYVVTTNAKRQADNLQKRIDAGEFEKKEPRPERRPERQEKTGDAPVDSVPPGERERAATKGDHAGETPAWPWFVAGGIAAILLLVWRLIRKRQ